MARGIHEARHLKVARFGDNMREVSVTEGDKVAAEQQLGIGVNGYGLADLEESIASINEEQLDTLLEIYELHYEISTSLRKGGTRHASLREAARIELGIHMFLVQHKCRAFTDTFENLGALKQLPGLAVQRMMAAGFGFGAEGDWKTAALVRIVKSMGQDVPGGGCSFMEDYTYHFGPDGAAVLGAHMLEICPSITKERPRCEIHPLGIGGKADPVRLVFSAAPGPAVNSSLVDLGDRFRLLINPVQGIAPPAEMPQLPVAHALWQPEPDLTTAAEAWIQAGGAHHTAYSQNVSVEMLQDFAHHLGIETIVIDVSTQSTDLMK